MGLRYYSALGNNAKSTLLGVTLKAYSVVSIQRNITYRECDIGNDLNYKANLPSQTDTP